MADNVINVLTGLQSDYLSYSDAQPLQDLQYNATDYLYNLEPQQNNLFYIDSFYDPYDVRDTDGFDTGSKKPTNIEYRIKKVSGFKLPALEISPEMMKTAFRWNYVASGRTQDNVLKIGWIEDAFWTVRRYHMNWINHWYNRFLDCMVVGQRGKMRNLVLYLFHYKNLNKDTAAPIQKAIPIARFEFKGLIPQELGEAAFEWGTPNSGDPVEISYKYNYLEIYFYPYTQSEKEFIGGMAEFIQKADAFENTSVPNTWNTAIVGKTSVLQGLNPEGQFKYCSDAMHQSVYYI